MMADVGVDGVDKVKGSLSMHLQDGQTAAWSVASRLKYREDGMAATDRGEVSWPDEDT